MRIFHGCKDYICEVIYNRRYRNAIFKFGELLLGAVLAIVFTLPQERNTSILICLATALLVFFVCIFLFVSEERDPKRFDIIEHIHSSNHEIAISWAYTMRNLLSHAGYIKLKIDIAKIVYDYFDKYNIENDKPIPDTGKTAGVVKATMLMDDFGWYRYEFSLEDADDSKNSIKEGISLAKECKDYSVVLRGFRHLSNIIINHALLHDEIRNESVSELKGIRDSLTELNSIPDESICDNALKLIYYIEIYIHVLCDEYKEALTIAEEQVKSADIETRAKLNEAIGIIHYKRKNYKKAIEVFREAAKDAENLRPGRYVSIVIYLFTALTDYFEENYNNRQQRLTRLGKADELAKAKKLFKQAHDIAHSRDSTKEKRLISSYNRLKESIKR